MLERWSAYRNIKFETPEHKRGHHYVSLIPAEILLLLSRAEIKGELPREGPGIIAINHESLKDPFLAHLLVVLKGRRTVRFFAHRWRLQEDVEPTEEAKKRRTQNDMAKIFKRFERWYLNGFNPIPVDIGGTSPESRRVNREAFETANKELREGRLVGMFPQGTRKPELDLLDMMKGITLLARRNPDVPVVPVGFNGTDGSLTKKLRVNIGPSFTFRDTPPGVDFLDFVADRIAEQIEDPSLKSAWRLNRRVGWSKEDIERSKGVYPEIGGTADLLTQIAKTDPDFVKLPQKEIDRQIKTAVF